MNSMKNHEFKSQQLNFPWVGDTAFFFWIAIFHVAILSFFSEKLMIYPRGGQPKLIDRNLKILPKI